LGRADLSALLLELFYVVSTTFKVPQVSVLFNFQGPARQPFDRRRRPLTGQLIYFTSFRLPCQEVF